MNTIRLLAVLAVSSFFSSAKEMPSQAPQQKKVSDPAFVDVKDDPALRCVSLIGNSISKTQEEETPSLFGGEGRGEGLKQTHVFIAGQDGYHTYRIPSVIVTGKGTVLAFCEGRRSGRSDAWDIDLVLKRSSDGGKTWSKVQLVWDEGENTWG